MSELTFSQAERRSYLVPALIALAVLGIAAGIFFWRTPMRMGDATVTHLSVVPTHTVFGSDISGSSTKVVGQQGEAYDDLYVVATVHIDNHLKVPLFINDLSATLVRSDDSDLNATAVEEKDLDTVYANFPNVKAVASAPLLRESRVPPQGSLEGMVLLHFPATQADWDQRKSATINIDFYHQTSMTAPIPK